MLNDKKQSNVVLRKGKKKKKITISHMTILASYLETFFWTLNQGYKERETKQNMKFSWS